MKKVLLLFPLVFVCLCWNARGQFNGNLWQYYKSAKQAPQHDSGTLLTNDSIVKLVKAGLDEDTIITMVRTQPGKYSLGVNDVIALKNAGISDKVISAMIQKPARSADPPPVALGSAGQGGFAAITDIGTYYKKDDGWIQVMPEMVDWKTGGVIKSMATVGIVKGDVNGRLNGQKSTYQVTLPAEFLIYVPEGTEVTEYQLIRLRTHRGGREFRTVTGGVFHVSGGATRDLLHFDYKKVADRMYEIGLFNLDAGEYGFLAPGSALAGNASAQLGKMYTFRVVE